MSVRTLAPASGATQYTGQIGQVLSMTDVPDNTGRNWFFRPDFSSRDANGHPNGPNWYYAQVNPDGTDSGQRTAMRQTPDQLPQFFPNGVGYIGQPTSYFAGFRFTIDDAGNGQWWAPPGWTVPTQTQARAQTDLLKSNIDRQNAGGTSVTFHPEAAGGMHGSAGGAIGMAGRLARWLGASIRLWVDLRDLPKAPPATGDVAKDFTNVVIYDEALAQFALTAELIDAATHIVESAIRDGAQLKEPTPELLKKVRPFLRSGVSFLAALRTLPDKPAMSTDVAKNLANLVTYRTALAEFAIETDLADSSAELAGMLFEAAPKLQLGAGAGPGNRLTA